MTGNHRGSVATVLGKASVPPGTNSSCHRARARAGSVGRWSTSEARIASKLAGPNAGAVASAWLSTMRSRRPARSASRPAQASILAAGSTPMTWPPGDTARAARTRTAPAPHPASSTRQPGRSRACSTRREATVPANPTPLLPYRSAASSDGATKFAVSSVPAEVTSGSHERLDAEPLLELPVLQHQVGNPLNLHRVSAGGEGSRGHDAGDARAQVQCAGEDALEDGQIRAGDRISLHDGPGERRRRVRVPRRPGGERAVSGEREVLGGPAVHVGYHLDAVLLHSLGDVRLGLIGRSDPPRGQR